jgi:hypothetical protein
MDRVVQLARLSGIRRGRDAAAAAQASAVAAATVAFSMNKIMNHVYIGVKTDTGKKERRLTNAPSWNISQVTT